MAHYLFRLDDLNPAIHWDRFSRLISLFNRYRATVILSLVPDSRDPTLAAGPPRPDFWPTVRRLVADGYIPAQHGCFHRYVTADPGLLGLRARSEFAGLPYHHQRAKLIRGQEMLTQRLGRPVTWFSAPAHSFDRTTCRLLRERHFTHISDGIALYPFRQLGLTWVPHQLWQPRRQLLGVWTIGLHPNTIRDQTLSRVERFLRCHHLNCQAVPLAARGHVLNRPYRLLWYAKFRALKRLPRLPSNVRHCR